MDGWKPGSTEWELRQLQYKLRNVKKGEHYSEDLKPTGKERTFFPAKMQKEHDVEKSKSYLQSLFMTPRMSRDFALDYANPRQELAKFAKYVDQIPSFDYPPLTMISAHDLGARRQIDLVVQGRESFIMEENRFNKSIDDRENNLEPDPTTRDYDRRMQYSIARENQLAQTASL
jgi:hypothetical protein